MADLASDKPQVTTALWLPCPSAEVGAIGSIYLTKSRTLGERWEDLRHELIHVLVDSEYLVGDDK